MKNIDFSYLGFQKEHPIMELLNSYGGQIYAKTQGLISPICASGLDVSGEELQSASFYLSSEQIARTHQLISIQIDSVEHLILFLWPLDSYQSVRFEATISDDNLSELDDRLFDIFNHSEAKRAIKSFVEGAQLKLNTELKMI